MRILKRLALLPLLLASVALVPWGSDAASLPAGCSKVQGTVVCTTFEGPGNNQGGVGTTTTSTTQGNTSNYSPTPQGTGDSSTCKPPKSQTWGC